MLASLVTAAVLASPPIGVRADVGTTIPVSDPQSRYFTAGFGGSATFELEVLRWLDVEAQVGYALLPKTEASPTAGNGTLLSLGLGARVRRTLDENLLVPWGEVLVNYGASGGSQLPLTMSAGLSLRPGRASGFMVGAFARFQQVFALSPAAAGQVVFDASLLSFGLSLEYLQSRDLADGDGDGVPDVRDACPDTSGDPAERGCVAEAAPSSPPMLPAPSGGGGDIDGDGTPDGQDRCPEVAGTARAAGCPDGDGDGIADAQDTCPTASGLAEDKGCPRYKLVVVTASKIELKQKLFFAYGLTKLLPRSDPLLEEVAQALKDYAGMCVRIEGHTDSQGGKQANLALSEGRAGAVRDALVSRGIDAARLMPKGYGDGLPIDNNATLEGRESNRRVEFVIVECGGKEAP